MLHASCGYADTQRPFNTHTYTALITCTGNTAVYVMMAAGALPLKALCHFTICRQVSTHINNHVHTQQGADTIRSNFVTISLLVVLSRQSR